MHLYLIFGAKEEQSTFEIRQGFERWMVSLGMHVYAVTVINNYHQILHPKMQLKGPAYII